VPVLPLHGMSDLSCCCELLRRTGTCSLAMRYGLVCWELKSVPAGRSGSQRPPCASAAGPQARLCAAPQPPGPPPDPGTPPASMRRASFCTCSQPSAQAVAHLFCRCKAHRLVAAAQPFNDTARLRGGRCDAEGSMGMKQNKKTSGGRACQQQGPAQHVRRRAALQQPPQLAGAPRRRHNTLRVQPPVPPADVGAAPCGSVAQDGVLRGAEKVGCV